MFTVVPQTNIYITPLIILKGHINTYCTHTSQWLIAVTTLTLHLSLICLGLEQASGEQCPLGAFMIDDCAKSSTSESWVSLYWREMSKTRGMLQFILTTVVDNVLYLLEPT